MILSNSEKKVITLHKIKVPKINKKIYKITSNKSKNFIIYRIKYINKKIESKFLIEFELGFKISVIFSCNKVIKQLNIIKNYNS